MNRNGVFRYPSGRNESDNDPDSKKYKIFLKEKPVSQGTSEQVNLLK